MGRLSGVVAVLVVVAVDAVVVIAAARSAMADFLWRFYGFIFKRFVWCLCGGLSKDLRYLVL